MTPTEKLIAEARELCSRKVYPNGSTALMRPIIIRLCDALEETQKTIEQTWEWDMYKAAQKEIERLRKELAALASESVKRDIALAKLEAEVMALEPKCGEWVKKTYTHEYANEETEERQYVVCSICGKQPPSGFGTVYYCHNCGARMEVEP